MLFLLHGLALSSVALAVGHFHQRLQLLLEPVALPLLLACGGSDPVARMRVAEVLLARAGALDDWQPLCWLVVSALLFSLLGALGVSVHWLRRARGIHHRSIAGLLGLHVLALLLAAAVLRMYEHVWHGVVTGLPTLCMAESLAMEGGLPVPAQRTLPQMLSRAGLLVPQAPDALAFVLCGVLLAAMAMGVWLWRILPVTAAD